MANIEKMPGLLQLFGQDTGTGVTAEAAAQQTGVTEPQNGEGALAAEVSAADPEAAFEQLIKGPYKQQFNSRVRQILRKRLGDAGEREAAEGEALHRHEAAAAALMQDYRQQEQALREFYPGFSMEKELENPHFARLLLQDVDMRTAYEVLHNHEILPAAMAYAARAAEAAMAKTIAADGARPRENGSMSRAAVAVRSDVNGLSPADIRAIARRVAAGERITFG